MTFGQPPQSTGLSLNLSQSGAPLSNGYMATPPMSGYSGYSAPNQGWYGPQQQPSPFSAMVSGLTGQDPYAPQAAMPPSETEILMTMLDQQYSVERFLASPLFPQLLEIIGAITTFSVLNILKNASYNFDEDEGVFALNTSALPEEFQTMSAENVLAQVTAMNNQLAQLIGQADSIKQQTLQNAGNSMLQAQLANAMANPGMLAQGAEAGGSFMRNFLTGGRA